MLKWTAFLLAVASLVYIFTQSLSVGPIADVIQISQKDGMFSPASVQIRVGEALRFLNDDPVLTHHAFLDTEAFGFDSGEQAPGHHIDVAFSAQGKFTVRCGIHPRMRLDVTVGQ